MKFKNFTYTKKKDNETKNYFVLLLDESEDPNHFGGIDLGKLSEDEVTQVVEIRKKYEEAMRPFIKTAYRQFIKENATDVKYSTHDQAQLPVAQQ
jgi:hypothetical protein